MAADEARAKELWSQYTKDSSLENKNELVVHYVYLVKNIVYRLLPVYKGYSNFDDLLSCGIIGLIDAIGRFSVNRDVRFEYYASMRIKGEIIDHMRKQDWAPSSLRRKIQMIENTYDELEKTLFREPTETEVAEHLDMDIAKINKIMEKAHMFNVLHFEEMLSEDYSLEHIVQDKGETPEEQFANKEMKRILGDMIDALPEKERIAITLYYYEEMTLKEIAGVLNVSESRVSQIHSKVIMKLRKKMELVLNS